MPGPSTSTLGNCSNTFILGVNVGTVTWRALAISGAIAGVGGLNYVLGYKHYYEEGFATGAGSTAGATTMACSRSMMRRAT